MGASLGSNPGRQRRRHRTFTEINVTPMVDVMLVLLVIFMVTAPMMTAGVQVDLPSSKAAALTGQDEPISFTIKADGTVFMQKTEIEIDSIGAKLEAIAGEKKDNRIFVRGDRSIDYGQVMRVVGEINAAGFNKVALITADTSSSSSSSDDTKKKK